MAAGRFPGLGQGGGVRVHSFSSPQWVAGDQVVVGLVVSEEEALAGVADRSEVVVLAVVGK